jgi:hypothetical protein
MKSIGVSMVAIEREPFGEYGKIVRPQTTHLLYFSAHLLIKSVNTLDTFSNMRLFLENVGWCNIRGKK